MCERGVEDVEKSELADEWVRLNFPPIFHRFWRKPPSVVLLSDRSVISGLEIEIMGNWLKEWKF